MKLHSHTVSQEFTPHLRKMKALGAKHAWANFVCL
jgi:hypothetical protein